MNETHRRDTEAAPWAMPESNADGASRLDQLLARFSPIYLQDMEKVALLDRTDTKILLNIDRLCNALYHLSDHYRVLEIEGQRRHHYQTLYFDTPDLDFYHQHHNGRRDRYKIRERAYVDSDLAFVEIKHKTRRDHTIKHRQPMPGLTVALEAPVADFIQEHAQLRAKSLIPTLRNEFRRITLVSTHCTERVTVDVNLRFSRYGEWIDLPGVVVAEVKQTRFSYDSDFLREMRYLGARPVGFSKYCTGISLLYPDVKHNAFKPRMMQLERLIQVDQRV